MRPVHSRAHALAALAAELVLASSPRRAANKHWARRLAVGCRPSLRCAPPSRRRRRRRRRHCRRHRCMSLSLLAAALSCRAGGGSGRAAALSCRAGGGSAAAPRTRALLAPPGRRASRRAPKCGRQLTARSRSPQVRCPTAAWRGLGRNGGCARARLPVTAARAEQLAAVACRAGCRDNRRERACGAAVSARRAAGVRSRAARPGQPQTPRLAPAAPSQPRIPRAARTHARTHVRTHVRWFCCASASASANAYTLHSA